MTGGAKRRQQALGLDLDDKDFTRGVGLGEMDKGGKEGEGGIYAVVL